MSRRVLDVNIDGVNEVIREIKKLPDKKVKKRELRKLLRTPAQSMKREVKKNAHVYKGKGERFKTTRFDGLESKLKLHAGTLKRSIAVFNGKKSASVYVGPRVLKRPKSSRGFYSNIKRWEKNGWYAMFLIYGTKGNDGSKGGMINRGIRNAPAKRDFLTESVKKGGNKLIDNMERRVTTYLGKKIKELNL